MDKKEFLSQLKKHLQKLPKKERDDILQDYNEYFMMGVAEDKEESQIIESLGSPKQLSKELLANYHIEEMEKSPSTPNMFRAVWAAIGLGFINLVLVLGPFFGLIGILIAGWSVGITGVISPLLVAVNALIFPGTFTLFELFLSIAFCGAGLFFLIGSYYATIWTKTASLRYLKFNMSIVKGGSTFD